MGTLLASDVIARAAVTLYDVNNAKWSQSELLGYLNDAQRVIATVQPTATAAIGILQLVPGGRQPIPAAGWLLIDILRNMGANGTTPGRAIRVVSRRLLEGFNPNWMTLPQSAVVQSYFYDQRDQNSFFVYPPATGGTYVEVNFAAVPASVTLTQPIAVMDVLEEALYDYIMYRACAKQGEFSPGPQIAAQYLELFNESLAQRSKAETSMDPNTALTPAIPGPPVAVVDES